MTKSSKYKYVALIPARQGSKGLPGKNSMELCGKKMIDWTIEAALGTGKIREIYVSTNDPEVVESVSKYDIKILPRPSDLCKDETTSSEVIQHFLENRIGNETLIYLQPTSPVRNFTNINNAIKLFESLDSTVNKSVVSMTRMPAYLEWLFFVNDQNLASRVVSNSKFGRRQDYREIYTLNGAIYIADFESLKLNNYDFSNLELFAYEMNEEESIDVDTLDDFLKAQRIISVKLALKKDIE